ncbi:DUF4417 domain-containing protein [Bifidobacterium cuniculi]|uniref:DUF4417 domain-containing protein n=1 Tax=Bifidobacterium cuniculi TaxID=1688 RepID=A0A087AWT9_9BIFI|nr:DUF4417 domain-containing protein [Bifidobacterium cuniculi]KFI63239.1 hypothetical protein BCUN_1168 [Bifidobacterium cuniculi]
MTLSPQSMRAGWRDVFHARLLSGAQYASSHELPWVEPSTMVPKRLIPYSQAKHTDDFNQWVCFYEDDHKFIADVWRNPSRALQIVRRFEGAISPDFSMYRDMPLILQEYAVFMNRATEYYWQKNGVQVIPNVRWGDQRTHEIACAGIPRCSTIAIGSYGALRDRSNRQYLLAGVSYVAKTLQPEKVIVYGGTPPAMVESFTSVGAQIVRIATAAENAHKKAA